MSSHATSAEALPEDTRTAPVVLFVVIYGLAFAGTTCLHELAHALTSVLLGGKPVMYQGHVQTQIASGAALAWVAAAGPLFSLAQGVLLAAVWRAVARRPPVVQLLCTWASIHGFVNAFGYLLTTPFVTRGDLGTIAQELAWSNGLRWTAFALGVFGILAVGTVAAPRLLRFAPTPGAVADARARAWFIMQIGVFPWLIVGVLSALANYPAPNWLGYTYDLVSGCYLLGTRRRAARLPPPVLPAQPWPRTPLWPWAAALCTLAAVFVFVLRPGVRVGW